LSNHKFIGFEDNLLDDGYGIIVSFDGRIKGIWIPDTVKDETIPQAVVDLCVANFGINPNTDEELSQTVH